MLEEEADCVKFRFKKFATNLTPNYELSFSIYPKNDIEI